MEKLPLTNIEDNIFLQILIKLPSIQIITWISNPIYIYVYIVITYAFMY